MFNWIKKWRVGLKRSVSDRAADLNDDIKGGSVWIKLAAVAVVVLIIFLTGLGMYWSGEAETFDVNQVAETKAAQYDHSVVTGTTTTATIITVAETLLEKPGGFLSNDVTPPGIILDNMPNWEYGVIIQIRDMSKAMREAFSRSQSQSIEDNDLANAEARFNFDHDSWLIPPSESKYREGIEYLEGYLQRLGDQDATSAQFFTRADNLRYWLSTVETRLGSLSQRLSASVGQRRLNTDLAGEENASRSTEVSNEAFVKTPWLQIDDVFYEARGSSWALSQFLRAIEVDFANVLEQKNARVSLQQIIRELEATQDTVYPPMILNGSGFGFFANHSLVMASYISRANAAIIDLRELLSQG